jgi:putative CRISPR-associated protein (TIGR02619 family)
MKNLLFVTVGVSALDAPRRIPDFEPSRRGELEPLAQKVRAFRSDSGSAKTEAGKQLFDPLLKLHLRFWAPPVVPWEDAKRCRETSAELITTAILLRKLADDTNLRADRIILLIPETPEAELSGRLIKATMESQEYRGHCSPPEVHTRSVPGIAQREAIERLPDALLCAVEENRQTETDRIIFNATAGYGATLILVGMLALRYGFRIYYQHETMTSPIFISQNLNIGWDARTWVLS